MGNIKEALDKEKIELENTELPAELEDRLRGALNRVPRKSRKGFIAAALIMFVLCFYSFDAIAYYGKKFLGYDKTLYGNIKELNERGSGQDINKSFRFNDGTEIMLDGIIFDDNKLIAFVKVSSSAGFDKINLDYSIDGLRFMKYYNQSGAGNSNKERTEINWILEFEPPAIYEKWLNFDISKTANGNIEEGRIKFVLDRNKAMGHTVKHDINKTIHINEINIKFDRITISPIAAVVDGEITGDESFNGDFLANGSSDHPLVNFDLIINGTVYNCGTRNIGGSENIMHFKNESSTVPQDIESLSIGNIKYGTEMLVDKMVKIQSYTSNLRVDTDKGNIIIKNVRQDNKSTYITIKSDVEFDIQGNPTLAIFAQGKDIASSEQTLDSTYNENGNAYTERTFKFDTLEKEMDLGIKVVYKINTSSETINIPVSK